MGMVFGLMTAKISLHAERHSTMASKGFVIWMGKTMFMKIIALSKSSGADVANIRFLSSVSTDVGD